MKIAAWNIRGFHLPLKQKGLQDFLKVKKVDIACILETKLKVGTLDNIMAVKFPSWQYTHNFTTHGAGRILLLWNQNKVDVEILDVAAQYLHARLRCKVSSVQFHATFLYGFHSIVNRRCLWENLENLSPDRDTPWILLGDFNGVLRPDERINGSLVSNYECRDLFDATSLLGLIDTSSTGGKYTWTNGSVWSKLDRVMINDGWIQAGHFSHTVFCPIGILSDHAASITSLFEARSQHRRMFQFFNMWTAHPDFLDTVRQAWSQEVSGTAQFTFCRRLKLLKGPLKTLNQEHFSHIQTRAETARQHVEALQDLLMDRPHDITLQQELRSARDSAWRLCQAERSFCYQKAKCRYLASSDRNSKLFHQTVRRRMKSNEIVSITTASGAQTTSYQELSAEFVRFYQLLLGTHRPVVPFDHEIMLAGPTVDSHRGLELLSLPTDLEIREIIFHMGDDRSPGPDGYTAAFYKKAWSVVGLDLCALVREFFTEGRLLRQLNHTVIALIPKASHAPTVGDYRPIACCNVVYKVIAKILANRLAGVLDAVINPAQAAFVEGRSLAENVLLAQELLRQYSRKRVSPRCLIKVDIRKAFDSVSWDFLSHALSDIGLPSTFVGWIMECVASTSFSIRINGDIHGHFTGQRGLRQGDPLSPYLFVICMEYFSRALARVTEQSEFNFHPRCAGLKISHLIYADDLMLFMRGDLMSIQIAWDCLQSFGRSSGLQVNTHKSHIFLAGVFDQDREDILRLTGIPVGELPVRYLGIPLAAESLKLPHYAPLIQQFKDHVQSWQPSSLSYAGRLELIRSVLQGVSCFWLSILPVPRTVVDIMTGICRQFLWNSKSSLVAWRDIVLPKEEGGLGLRDFRVWNSALLAKYIWDIHSRRESLWARWIHHYYLAHRSFWEIQPKKEMSCLFRRLLVIRDNLFGQFGSEVAVIDWFRTCMSEDRLVLSRIYHCLRPRARRQPWFRTVWSTLTPPKYSFCLWLAVRGRLPTMDRLDFLAVDRTCIFCGCQDETLAHLLFRCLHTRGIWETICAWCGIHPIRFTFGAALRSFVTTVRGNHCISRLRRVALATTVYYIWLARNRARFEQTQLDAAFLLRRIRTQVYRAMFSLYPGDLITRFVSD